MRHSRIYSIALVAMLALAGCNHESADWKKATAADTADGYSAFLKDHPSSSYAAAANARIKALSEDHDWQAAASTDTRDAYDGFVSQHPDSKWVQEARIRIENFAQSSTASASESPPGVVTEPSADTSATKPASASAPHEPKVRPAATTSAMRTLPPKDPVKVASAASASHSTSVASATSAHNHFVQLGAFSSKERAQTQWKTLSAKYPGEFKALKPDYQQIKSKQGSLMVRLRVAVSSKAAGEGLCGTLHKHSQSCVVAT
jgi:hypothetical protein